MKRTVHRRRHGMSLIEVLISLFILTTISAAAGTLISTAFQTTSIGRQRLVALSLANEGIEAMRTIYQTNLLRYPLHRDRCWNVQSWAEGNPCDTDISDGDTSIYITAGTYRIAIDTAGQWQLEAATIGDAQRIKIATNGEYVQTDDRTLPLSPFSRRIEITYLDRDPATGTLSQASGITQFMRVAVTVSWTSRSVPHAVTLTENLTAIPQSV